jgi:hypothetical protein
MDMSLRQWSLVHKCLELLGDGIEAEGDNPLSVIRSVQGINPLSLWKQRGISDGL